MGARARTRRPRPSAGGHAVHLIRPGPAVDAGVQGPFEGPATRGFRFVGPVVAYALMQSAGLVDDHLAGCHVEAGAARAYQS